MNSDGVGILKDSPSEALDVNGNIKTNGALYVDDGHIGLNPNDDIFIELRSTSPEGILAAKPGAIAIDTVNGKMYLKEVNTTATGWKDFSTLFGFTITVHDVSGNEVLNAETVNFEYGNGIRPSYSAGDYKWNIVTSNYQLSDNTNVTLNSAILADYTYTDVHIGLTNGGPALNSTVTLPAPTSAVAHCTVTVFVDDEDATYDGVVAAGTDEIWSAGTLTNSETLADGDIAIYRCLKIDASTYKWVRLQ